VGEWATARTWSYKQAALWSSDLHFGRLVLKDGKHLDGSPHRTLDGPFNCIRDRLRSSHSPSSQGGGFFSDISSPLLDLGGVLAVVRVGICCWATYRAFIHQESLDEIPLIALLMPEYLITPGDPASPSGMWALTAQLVIGSFVAVSVLALLVCRFGGRAEP
jgi:hypothetical protein